MDVVSGASLSLKMLAKLFPWLVGKFYPEDRLAELLDVQPTATGECITLQPFTNDASCWLAFTNLSPFVLTVDRVEIQVVLDGAHATLYYLFPERIPPSEKKVIFARGLVIISPQAMEVARKATRVRLDVRAYIKSSARDFLYSRHLDDVRNYRLLN